MSKRLLSQGVVGAVMEDDLHFQRKGAIARVISIQTLFAEATGSLAALELEWNITATFASITNGFVIFG